MVIIIVLGVVKGENLANKFIRAILKVHRRSGRAISADVSYTLQKNDLHSERGVFRNPQQKLKTT